MQKKALNYTIFTERCPTILCIVYIQNVTEKSLILNRKVIEKQPADWKMPKSQNMLLVQNRSIISIAVEDPQQVKRALGWFTQKVSYKDSHIWKPGKLSRIPSNAQWVTSAESNTYCTVAKEFTVAAVAVFASTRPAVIWGWCRGRWAAFTEGWSITGTAIAMATHTVWWAGWSLQVNVIYMIKTSIILCICNSYSNSNIIYCKFGKNQELITLSFFYLVQYGNIS